MSPPVLLLAKGLKIKFFLCKIELLTHRTHTLKILLQGLVIKIPCPRDLNTLPS